MKSISRILVVLAVIVCPALARGDMTNPCEWPTGGKITSIKQVGQDVHVGLDVNANSPDCGAYAYSVTLWRINKTANTSMKIDGASEVGEPTEGSSCWEWGYIDTGQQCGGGPDICEDCDGDAVLECSRGYCSGYHLEWVDSCPPPGTTYYHLSSYGLLDPSDSSSTYGHECESSVSFNVADSNKSCGPWDSKDPEKDPCMARSSDTNLKIFGCGGCEAGRENPGPALAGVMFAIGFAALMLARRKR